MIRVKLLSAGRLTALGLFIAVAAALALYLSVRQKRVDSDQRPKLQGRVVAVFNNTRYAHEINGKVRFTMTAGTDKTYEDGTHELEQVKLESFGIDGTRHDVITSGSAKITDPSNLNKLDAEFISNVVVQTTDGLTVKTSYLHYDHLKNTVDTDKLVEFEGRNFAGRVTGLMIEAGDERAHLLKDVDVTIKPDGEAKGGQSPTGAAARGDKRRDETPEEKAARKARKRARKLERQRASETLARSGAGPNDAGRNKSRAAGGGKPGAPLIAANKPTRIRSQSALLEKKDHRVTFDGSVIVTRDTDEMRADRMIGFTNTANHFERIEARGNSYLKQSEKAEIKSPDMDFFFAQANQIQRVVASGGAHTRSLGAGPPREATASVIEALFVTGAQGNVVDTIKATGNAAVQMHAPRPANDKANPTERELTANAVTLQFHANGKDIKSAEAKENAVMTITPIRAARGADKKTIRAPHMSALFYPEGSGVKTFNAAGGVKVEVEATVANAHPPRVTTSKEMSAEFLADSQDFERITQEGDFKYNEGDRNAVAERAIYDGQKEVLNLRGMRPQAWDSKSRTQADEIDYDHQKDETYARGDVRTTYYSRETTNDSTPFKNAKSPIFITAERAEARNKDGVAVYTTRARGWQDDNFVKADRIELYQNDKRMVASGKVESTLYSVKGEQPGGKREAVPGFASAEKMTYSDADRLIHYDGGVKARQGTDRIEASSIDVYLQKETNEVDHMLAEGNVVLTQPGRRGAGDKLAYTSADGRAVLSGKAARVDDGEKGSTMGAQLTFYSRDDKIFVDNQQGTGRVRSTHRLKKP
ncbi:MAG TPA: LPS export ABC transporter periplasmic protein LptC [Blastocatellia bacterium]|nr:LPS export ABC transporter periplasmic protein LptC [Blastocatellia bacterium]